MSIVINSKLFPNELNFGEDRKIDYPDPAHLQIINEFIEVLPLPCMDALKE